MTELHSRQNRKKGQGYVKALRILTCIFAVLGPSAMIGSALVMTLIEGDWWFDLFLFFFAAMVMLSFAMYISLLTLLWELSRHVRSRAGDNLHDDTAFIKVIHRILTGVAMAGIITIIPFVLVFTDLLKGYFAWPHLACGGVLLVLYMTLGVYHAVTCVKEHRRAERQRLEEEKQAWEKYLN